MLRKTKLVIAAVVFIAPFAWMLVLSLQGTSTAAYVGRLSLDNYERVLAAEQIVVWLYNSMLVAVASAGMCVLIASAAGYAFAKVDTPIMRGLFWLCMVTMIVPRQVMLIALYKEMVAYRLLGTVPGMVLPVVVMPLGLFLFRQFAKSIPNEFIEAARMDGAGELLIFARVVVPLMIPAAGVVGLLYFVQGWNDYNWQLLISTGADTYTFIVAISAMARGELFSDHGMTMAAAVIGTLPIAAVFLAAQRTLIQGLNTEGI